MKVFVILFILIFSFHLGFSQELDEQPKIRYSTGFFSVNYELGDLDVSEEEIALHLEKTSPKAYYDFKRGISLGKQSGIWSIVGSGGFLLGVLSKNNGLKLAGYGTSLIGYSVSLGTLLGSYSKKEKGIEKYNKEFGYR